MSRAAPHTAERRRQRSAATGLNRAANHAERSETISGSVERVTFHSDESGYCVIRVKARGIRDLVTVVGYSGSISAGEWVTATGGWVNDVKYGPQFKARFLKSVAPTSESGIRSYLASGMIRGVGKHFASKLVDEFGTDVFEVIQNKPERLREVNGVGPVRANSITEAWNEQKHIREIMVFLHSHGVSTARAVRIYKTYGDRAVETISENPYRLSKDIWGIGFRTADEIAGRLGIQPDSEVRLRAGLHYVLTKAMDDGNLGLPRGLLQSEALKVLEIAPPGSSAQSEASPDQQPAVTQELVESALQKEFQSRDLVAEEVSGLPCVFSAWSHRIEQALAEKIKLLNGRGPPWRKIDHLKALPWVEKKAGIEFSESQAEAVRLAIESKFLVITGGPGVGKTTILNSVLKILSAIGTRILLCAPTGRAAKKLSDATGRSAVTIHRLLAIDPRNGRFRFNENKPLECDLVVVDETSMVDVPLMHALVAAVPNEAAILLVGDIDQLPSVGPGRVLGDIIESEAVPVVRLNEVFRQAAQSRIIVNAHRVNSGKMPELQKPDADSDFYFVPAEDSEAACSMITTIVHERIPAKFGLDPIQDIQVLCPMNRGRAGVRSLNAELQLVLNPGRADAIEKFGWNFAAGDKIMQISNDYDKSVFNGDIGYISSVDPIEGILIANFDGMAVQYAFGELDSIVPAYATTIHKSQGSEFPAVVMPMLTEHFPMLKRNLLYTGLTRGRRLVVLVGQPKAVAISVRELPKDRRISRLENLLGTIDGTRPANGSIPTLL